MQVKEGRPGPAARKRAAVEVIAREGAALRKAARRWSLCEDDAEDAYQRALEIMLVKAPSDRPRELVPWAKTVIKHEALAIRRSRERMLSSEDGDPGAWIPAGGDGPENLAEVGEHVARSREALRTLKPAELRSLTLLAAGYSYAEIGEITGFSRTKINRCLAEGRDRFRRQLSRSEDGSRCAEMLPLLSAYCDGEANAEDAATVRDHLRACAGCRATMRAYRRVPASVAALAPALPVARSLLERAQELLLGLQARLPGGGGVGDGSVAQVAAAGGAQSAGAAGLAKLLAICAGAAGSAGACIATGLAPVPLDLAPQRAQEARVERVAERVVEAPAPAPIEYVPAPEPEPSPDPRPEREIPQPEPEPEPAPVAEAGAIEYEPAPEPAPAPAEVAAATAGAGAAGEFGP